MVKKLDHDKIRELYKEGYSFNEIATAVGAKSTLYIQQILKQSGLWTGHKEIDTGKIKALRKAGWSITDIVFEMGLPAETVKEVLNETVLHS